MLGLHTTTKDGIDIIVNVYDLHDSNSYLYCIGTGFYHTGVQIEGFEYCFSSHGVVRTRPRNAGVGKFRETILMGKFFGTMRVIKEIIIQMRKGTFAPGKYNLVSLNCNHFTDALVNNLLDTHIPPWVNRLAEVGTTLSLDTNAQFGILVGQENINSASNQVVPKDGTDGAEKSASDATSRNSSSVVTPTQSLDLFSTSLSSVFSVLCFAPSADMVCDDDTIVMSPLDVVAKRKQSPTKLKLEENSRSGSSASG